MKLSAHQQKVLDALRRGGRLHYVSGIQPYAFLSMPGSHDHPSVRWDTVFKLRDAGVLEVVREDWRGAEYKAKVN